MSIPDKMDFLQPAQCAFADDLAVASSSFGELISALALAFRSVDYINCLSFKTTLQMLLVSV